MSKNKKRTIALVCTSIIFILLAVWIAIENKTIETNYYTIQSEEISSAFDSYTIAQISDLHNDTIGKDNIKLINALKDAQPDIIVVTGDLIDSRNTDIKIAVSFMKGAVKIAPCYYINGNHEARITEQYDILKEELTNIGVTILENEYTINLIGINDPDFHIEKAEISIDNRIEELNSDESFTILLSHRPEAFEVYVKNDIDLVFTGHAHGGQFRLPFVGGLFAPHQGAFPKYDSGLYAESGTNMLVSRGLGNSIFPFRFNNRPEIVVAVLKSK